MTIIFDEKDEKIISFKYQTYVNVFDKIDANKLLKHKSHDHAIETKNKILFFEFLYNLSIIELETLRIYLNDNLKKKFIIFFFSSTKTFIMFVKIKNDDLRLCVNYKNLNVITVKNRYFISLIKQLFNRLMKATIFTKLNIRSAYNALRIRIDDEWKTTFRCKYDHFEYRIMSFELTNASAIFQSYIHLTLREYLNIFCIVYLNDILIYSNDKSIHEKHVRLIFEKFRKCYTNIL